MSGGDRIFNIGRQEGVISNVAGDQHLNYAGRDLTIVHDTVDELRTALETARLSAGERREALQTLDAVEADFAQAEPDRRRVADKLEHLTAMLTDAGALATAADRLRQPLQRLAGWLGAAGAGVLSLLG